MKSYFVHNGSVDLHVLENREYSSETPSLLVIGGLWEPAERAIPLLSGLSSHVVAVSLRGRGLSSTPLTGYGLEEHLSDIEAVVKHCKLKNYCVLGFSRGAAYSIAWSLGNQHDMCGLILVDQPPIHGKSGPNYVEFWSNFIYLEVPILNYMRLNALEGIDREALEVDFSSQLSQLMIPVNIFVGRNRDAKIPTDLRDSVLKLYTEQIHKCQVVEFLQSGHMIPDEEQQKYIEEVALFIENCSASE
jgi:pimeloyl-ACP methyl ester carboxylesterase